MTNKYICTHFFVVGYEFLGPGTKLDKKLREGTAPSNKLDLAAQDHDIAYRNSTSTSDRAIADTQLANKAWDRVLASDSSLGEKATAWLTTNAMKLKGYLGQGRSLREKGNPQLIRGKCQKKLRSGRLVGVNVNQSVAQRRRRKFKDRGWSL